MLPFPLEAQWERLCGLIASSGPVTPTGLGRDLYADVAEHIVRRAVDWQDGAGAIVDPYHHAPDHFSTARFLGALGHLLAAGRCTDLLDNCVAAYQATIDHFSSPSDSPEFLTKELVFAHVALRSLVPGDVLQRWEDVWERHDPRTAYNCTASGLEHNFCVFALVGEYLRARRGLPTTADVVDDLLAGQRRHFTELGMYRDPGDPMTYDL